MIFIVFILVFATISHTVSALSCPCESNPQHYCTVPITECCNIDQWNRLYYLDSNITANGDCITFLPSGHESVLDCKNNTIIGNGTGNGINITMENNVVKFCGITNFTHGISLEGDSAGTIIRNNKIYNNSDKGIYFRLKMGYSNTGNNIRNNIIINNKIGIRNPSGYHNTIYNNFFMNTINNAYDDYGPNFWNTTKCYIPSGNCPNYPVGSKNIIGSDWIGGNYWHNYTGQDLDGDGLGDTNLPWRSMENCRMNYDPCIWEGGDYLPLVDINSPKYSNINEPTDPSVYSSSATYNFNITWTDNIAVDKVILEFNQTDPISSTLKNYTDATKVEESFDYTPGNIKHTVTYSKTFTNLAIGTYNYRWYANDTRNNWNSTDLLSFTVVECQFTSDCGFCEKCSSNVCVNQTSSEDLKNQCDSGLCASGYCNGAGACYFNSSTTVCRASAGDCDIEEKCTGNSPLCPTNLFNASGTDCGTCAECDGLGSCIYDGTQHGDCGFCQQCTALFICGYQTDGIDIKNECPAVACDGNSCNGAGNCQDVTAESGYLCTEDCHDCVSGTCTHMTENNDGNCNAECNYCSVGNCVNRNQCDATECISGKYCDTGGGSCINPNDNSQPGKNVCEACVSGAQHSFGESWWQRWEALTKPYCCENDVDEYYVNNGVGAPGCCDNSAENCLDVNGICMTEYPTEKTCNDGIDNDCDGKIDASDPDCSSSLCSGPIFLTLNPNPVNYTINKTVTAISSGLNNCNGRNITVKDVPCDYWYGTKCSCSASNGGCPCAFPTPNPGGYYTYYACLDMNQNGKYETGEKDTETLNVLCKTSGQSCNANIICCKGYSCYNGFCKPSGGGGTGRVIDK